MTDPRIVPQAKPMEEVTYAEIRELSYMGASVLHDEAISPVREVGIPICIRNTNAPDHPGTRIVSKLSDHVEKSTEIAGIAGKRAFAMISLEKSLMNKEVGFVYRLLGILERHGVSFEHCPSSIDSVSAIVETSQIEGKVELVLEEIKSTLRPDKIEYVPQISLVAVVGQGMSHQVGIAAKVFIALRDAAVNVRLINQGSSELNIIVGVVPEDYEKAVRVLYRAFVPD
jgi:aspartate kinase